MLCMFLNYAPDVTSLDPYVINSFDKLRQRSWQMMVVRNITKTIFSGRRDEAR